MRYNPQSLYKSEAAASSSLRRIQRLIAECVIDTDIIAKLILKLVPVVGPYDLAMDRTNWKFSDTNINILTLGVIYEGMAFPVVFKMMDKRGNSNTEERIHDSIGHLMADREFVGSEWLGYLNAMGIHYHIRIRENFKVVRHGQETIAFWLFNDVRLGEGKHLVAYVWRYLVGIFIHENIRSIKTLAHGRKDVSLFKYGLDYIQQCLLNHTDRYRIDVFKFLSYA